MGSSVFLTASDRVWPAGECHDRRDVRRHAGHPGLGALVVTSHEFENFRVMHDTLGKHLENATKKYAESFKVQVAAVPARVEALTADRRALEAAGIEVVIA